jgi:chromosome segregation ATPase
LADDDYNNLRDAFVVLSKARQDATEQIEEALRVKSVLEQKVELLRSKSNQVQQVSAEMESSFSGLEKRIEDRRGDFDKLSALADSLASNLQKVISYLDKLHSEVDAARNSYGAKRGEVEALQHQIVEVASVVASRSEEVAALRKAVDDLFSEFRAESERMARILPEAEARIQEARRIGSSLASESENMERLAEAKKNEILGVIENFNSGAKQVRSLADSVAVQIEDIKKQVEEKGEEAQKVKATLEFLVPDLQGRLSRLDELKAEIEGKLASFREIEKSAGELMPKIETKISFARQGYETLRSEIEKSRALIDDKVAQLERERRTIADLSEGLSRISQFQKESGGLGEKMAEANSKLASIRQVETSLSTKFADVSDLLSSLESRLASADEKGNKLRSAVGAVESGVSSAKQSLEFSTSNLLSIKSSLDSFGERVENLRKEQEGVSQSLMSLTADFAEKRLAFQKLSSETSRALEEDSKRKTEIISDYEKRISAVTEAAERSIRKGNDLQSAAESMVHALEEELGLTKTAIRESESSRLSLTGIDSQISSKLSDVMRKLEALEAKENELRNKATAFSGLEEQITGRLAAAKKKEETLAELERKLLSLSDSSERSLRKSSEMQVALESAQNAAKDEMESMRLSVQRAADQKEKLQELEDNVSRILDKDELLSKAEEALGSRLSSIEERLAQLSETESALERKASEIDAIKNLFERKLSFTPSAPRPTTEFRAPAPAPISHAETLAQDSRDIMSQVADLDALKAQRKELSELLLLLSTQREQGLVSDKHFEEISSQTRARLREIEGKIAQTLALEEHLDKHEADIGKIKSMLRSQKAYYK